MLIPGIALVAFLVTPIAALVFAPAGGFVEGLRHESVGPALRLSLWTTLVSLLVIILLGTPLAWVFARGRSRWVRVAELVVRMPIVVPPAVAGVALLLAFGRRGLVGGWLEDAGASVAFSSAAVVIAQIFVAAPFYVESAAGGFRAVSDDLIHAARSLGAAPTRAFFTIVLPIAAPGIVGGAAMAWARALGEFGATLMFAGNLTGVSRTLPLAIYTTMETDMSGARSMSVVLVAVAFAVLVTVGRPWKR